MHKGLQKRAHERLPTSCQFRVYTSIAKIGYSVDLGDISRSGALIMTKHTPKSGEVINIAVSDRFGRKLFTCRGQVKNIRSSWSEYRINSGFGIQFTENLTLEQLKLLTDK